MKITLFNNVFAAVSLALLACATVIILTLTGAVAVRLSGRGKNRGGAGSSSGSSSRYGAGHAEPNPNMSTLVDWDGNIPVGTVCEIMFLANRPALNMALAVVIGHNGHQHRVRGFLNASHDKEITDLITRRAAEVLPESVIDLEEKVRLLQRLEFKMPVGMTRARAQAEPIGGGGISTAVRADMFKFELISLGLEEGVLVDGYDLTPMLQGNAKLQVSSFRQEKVA